MDTAQKDKKKKSTKYPIEDELAQETEKTESHLAARVESLELPPAKPAPDFYTLAYLPTSPRNNYNDTCEPSSVFDADQSYSNILLAHAALYNLGDLWHIDSLKSLARFKLYKTLCVFKLDDEHIQDIIDLARYVNTKAVIGIEQRGMREVVSQFMSQHKLVLAASEEFMDFLGEGGQLVKDFLKVELQGVH
jgi:hypothetical protein